MERIVATYKLEGHEVNVIEMVDEDIAWYQLVVDNTVLPSDVQPPHIPSEREALDLLRRWLAGPL